MKFWSTESKPSATDQTEGTMVKGVARLMKYCMKNKGVCEALLFSNLSVEVIGHWYNVVCDDDGKEEQDAYVHELTSSGVKKWLV